MAVLPVKEMRGIFGCVTIASPVTGPVPNTILHMPGGRPREGGSEKGRERLR